MKTIIKIFSVLIIILGIFFIKSPDIILNWLEESLQHDWFYWFAIIFRFILGTILLLACKVSKFPVFVKALGYLSIAAAIVFIFIGQEAFQKFFSEILPHLDGYGTISGFIAMAIGVILYYSFTE